MSYTFDDLLNALKPSNNSSNKLTPREIWGMIANKESYDKMGFSSESELKDFIAENPYNNL